MESLAFDINGCQKFVLPCDPTNLRGLGKLGSHHGIQDSKAFEDEHSVVDRRHVQIQIVYSVMKERPLTPCSLQGERMKSSVSCGRPKLPSSRVKLLKCGIY